MMSDRLLGDHTGLRVSELALGTARLGTAPGRETDPVVARSVLDAFAEAGGTFLDTSSAYQQGRAEERLGAFLADAGRDRFVIASKYGRTAEVAPARSAKGCHRRAMQREVEGSLRRLGTDRIDLYFPHFDDGFTPIDEIVRGLDDLTRAGKIVYVGLSNFPAWRIASAAMLAELRGWNGVAVLQMQYNLLERGIEREHLPLARARGMAVMGWSPLAGGALTKAGDPASGTHAIADTLREVAREVGGEPSGVALAWVRAKGVFPVIGPRTREHVAASLGALGIHLTEAQLQRIDGASAPTLGYPYDLLAQQRQQMGATEPQAGAVL